MNIPRASIWPTVTFNTTRPAEMAKAEQWVRSLIDGEAAEPSCDRCDGRGWVCPHCGPRVAWHHEMDCSPANEVPCGKCQASGNPTDDGEAPTCPQETSEAPNSTQGPQNPNRRTQGVWPPPKPGTHESQVAFYLRWHSAIVGGTNRKGQPAGGRDEYRTAANWSTANRKENA